MASYQQIESDERMENGEGRDRLEFKSFLGNEDVGATQNSGTTAGRGYLRDQSRSSFWNVEYYQHHFEVDTKLVLKRCYTALLPTSPEYTSAHVTPSPDLYGPFWTLTTLALALFFSSSFSHALTTYLSSPTHTPSDPSSTYDFGLLSIAVALVYAFGIGVPVCMWGILRYLGVSEWSIVEAVSVWGYAMVVWVPVSLLCIIPVPIVRWVLIGLAFCLSGYFLLANVYPIIATAEAKAARLLVIIIVAIHAGLAITFKLLFYSTYIVEPIGGGEVPGDPLGTR